MRHQPRLHGHRRQRADRRRRLPRHAPLPPRAPRLHPALRRRLHQRRHALRGLAPLHARRRLRRPPLGARPRRSRRLWLPDGGLPRAPRAPPRRRQGQRVRDPRTRLPLRQLLLLQGHENGSTASPQNYGRNTKERDNKPTPLTVFLLASSGTNTCGKLQGVDSSHDSGEALQAAKALARSSGAVVAVSGAVDFITDGEQVVSASNGVAMMQKITATRCAVTALIAAFVGGGSFRCSGRSSVCSCHLWTRWRDRDGVGSRACLAQDAPHRCSLQARRADRHIRGQNCPSAVTHTCLPWLPVFRKYTVWGDLQGPGKPWSISDRIGCCRPCVHAPINKLPSDHPSRLY